MSIKKTSILALSVLLSYESFAAPTVLATTPRLGASSSVASTGRGKATTSVSIGGGLNKLTSNRGQSSFTPNSAPTDKQNELIENFQKEIQNVRDAVAEELQAQNDKIRELESVIEEKDEKIAELEESIDEKIESKGFVTAESVTSEISTAKQEAVRQATNAAVKEVNSMGFAKTATVQSDILTAKNAAIAQAKTEAVAEVNGMGFAKTTTIESDILTAKNAAIEQAKNEAVAAVNSMGFATNASVQNLKSEITTERNAALKSYATSADVSSAVATLATKKDLQDLELGVDEATVAGIVDEVLDTKKVISEDTPAFQEVQQQVAAMPTTYAKSSALTDLESMVEKNTQDIAKADTAIKAEATTRTEIVATLATKKELQNLELGVDETTVAGIVDEVLDTKKVISEDTPAFQEVQQQVAAMPTTYAKSSALTSLDTMVKKNAQDITATQESVNNISDTIADTLLSDEDFKGGVLAGLSTELTELPARVTELDNAVKGLGNTYATKKELENLELGVDETTVAGIVDEVLDTKKVISEDTPAFQEVANLRNKETLATLLGDTYAKSSALTSLDTRVTKNAQDITATQESVNNISDTIADTLLSDEEFKGGVLAGLSTELTELPERVTALDNRITGLSATYATQDDLDRVDGKFASYVEIDDVNNRFTALDSKFVKPATLTEYATKGELGDYAKLVNVEALNTELTNLKNPKTLADYLGDTYVTPGKFDTVLSANGKFKELNNTVSGLGTTYATKASLEELQNAKTLANLLGDTYVTPDKFDNVLSANGTFSALNTRVNGLGNTVSTLESSVTSLSNSIDELEQRVPVDDGDPDHEMVTPGN